MCGAASSRIRIYDESFALNNPGESLKKTVSAFVLLLALTACGGPEQLSTEETCSEAMAIITAASGGADEVTDEQAAEAGEQLDELADRASDPLKEEIELFADVAKDGNDGISEAQGDPEFEQAMTVIEETCGF